MPGSTPIDLAERLASRGLEAEEVVGMARSTTQDHQPNAQLTVEELGAAKLEAFSRVMAEGWGAPLGALYGALTAARLSCAQALGIPLATSHALALSSAPLLERSGFDAWFRYRSFSPGSSPA